MRRYATVSLVFFSLVVLAACVPYYVDYSGYYESPPAVVEAPVLPPQIVLETRPYYFYGGFYYYWDVDRDFWVYSRQQRGPWYRLPPSHYPERFQYRGEWHEGRRGRGDEGRGGRGEERERGR